MTKTRDEIIWANVQRESAAKGWTNVLLAEKIGSTPQHINAVKHGRRGIGKRLLQRFAQALDVSEAELLVETTEFALSRTGPLPIFEPDEAALIKDYIEHGAVKGKMAVRPVTVSRRVSPRAFGVQVTDESMSPRFLPGDIAVVDPEAREDDDAAIYFVAIGRTVYLRKIMRHIEGTQETRLVASNPLYPDMVVKNETSLRIIGKVVELRASLQY